MSSFIVQFVELIVPLTLSDKQMSLLEENIVANFSSISNKGMPHMVPVWIILHDGKIYFLTKIDRSSYKHILGNQKVGISIVHPKEHNYLSLYGYAKFRTKDEYMEYDYVVERIIRKYAEEFNKANEMIKKVKNDEDRVLVEVTPVHSFPKL